MSADISVNPDVKIIPGKITTLISYPDRLTFVCSECGHTKHVQYLVEPTILQRRHDEHDYCVCGQQMSNQHLLRELYASTGGMQSAEEVRLHILSLASATA